MCVRRAGVAQWVKTHASKPYGLSLLSRTYIVEELKERTDSSTLSFDLHIHEPWHMCTVYMHRDSVSIKTKKRERELEVRSAILAKQELYMLYIYNIYTYVNSLPHCCQSL